MVNQPQNMSNKPLQHGQAEIEHIVNESNLPINVGETARAILGRASEEGLFSGRPIEVTAGATVVIACRQASLPYSSLDIASVSTASASDKGTSAPSLSTKIERTRRKLETELDIDTKMVKPSAYLDRFVPALELSSRTEEVARDVLSRAIEADDTFLSGKSSAGVAGAAIYLATLLRNERCTQTEIAGITSSEVAIRTNYHALLVVFNQSNIRFEEDDLDTDRFEHEVDKILSGNGNSTDEETGSMNEIPKHDERIDSGV